MRAYLYPLIILVLVVSAATYAIMQSGNEGNYSEGTENNSANEEISITPPIGSADKKTGEKNAGNAALPLSENELTDRQQALYWASFNWMMEWGKDSEIKSFEDTVTSLVVTYHIGKRFMSEKNRLCRPYSLLVKRGDEQMRRRGIACKRNEEDWCQQRENKPEKCQKDSLGELDNILNSTSIKKRNLSINTERFFRDLGF